MKIFRKKNPGNGIVLFNDTAQAIYAEKILSENGFVVSLVAPPAHLRQGCDLAVSIEISQKPAVERFLREKKIDFIKIIPMVSEERKPVEVIRKTVFDGNAVMIKAANMKLSFNIDSGEILNISGGGCPDVPYLYHCLVGKKITEVEAPENLGFTLCALMLNRAYEESLRLLEGK